MDEKTLKNIEKWNSEIAVLAEASEKVEAYSRALEEGGEAAVEADEAAAAIFDENSFIKMDWEEVRQDGDTIRQGLGKLKKKISDRSRKIVKAGGTVSGAGDAGKEKAGGGEDAGPAGEDGDLEREWTEEINKCAPGAVYYHWAYGKLEVVAMEDDYIYLRILDRKGCRHEWLQKNNAVVEIDGKEEEVKEFSIYSIGRWLFPEADDVEIPDQARAHRIFAER